MLHADRDPSVDVKTFHGFPADHVISALQKEIRRGNTENSSLLAYEMILHQPGYGRLSVVPPESHFGGRYWLRRPDGAGHYPVTVPDDQRLRPFGRRAQTLRGACGALPLPMRERPLQ